MINPEDKKFKDILGEGRKMSQAQIDLCNFIAYGIGNATVQARAGSGKSKTIELMCAAIHPRKKILILAYNTHIAENLREKLKNLQNVEVCTYHSLGLKILKAKLGNNIELDENKYHNYIQEHIRDIDDDVFDTLKGGDKRRYKRNIESLVNYSRFNKAQSVTEIQRMAEKYGIRVIGNECEVAKNVLNWGSQNTAKIDFSDMIWLPFELGITANIKYLQYDVIFIDEAQDSSPVQQNLIDICKNRSTRFVSVGDREQCINAWAGADTEAFENFEKMDNVTPFKLNVSYRCSRKVADVVRKLVPDFETPDFAIDGNVEFHAHLSDIKIGDLVLCRMTSPLVRLHLHLLSQNIPSKLYGYGYGEEIIEMLNSYDTEDIDDIKMSLKTDLIALWERIAETDECDLKDVVMDSMIGNEYDKILTIETVSEGCATKEDVINRVAQIFNLAEKTNDSTTENTNGVLRDDVVNLCTVHKSKGLECDNVFILCPSLMPSKMARQDWERTAEKNVLYVALSRAKVNLSFVDEKEFSFNPALENPKSMFDELNSIKEDIYS